jgi:hypothetical protein
MVDGFVLAIEDCGYRPHADLMGMAMVERAQRRLRQATQLCGVGDEGACRFLQFRRAELGVDEIPS